MLNQKTFIKTGKPEFDDFIPRVRDFLEQDTLDIVIDGKNIRGYRTPDTKSIWIRDYSDMMRGFKYFESDLKSAVEHFAETQAASGRIFDYFTTFPEKPPCERENWTKYVRVPVEADVEFRFVKAVYLAWQATGDDEWLLKLLPHLEKALTYIRSHPWRWDPNHGLVKRAYTIDTWDFAYTAGRHDWLQFQIDKKTYWGIMHGDNSGYYQAFRILASFFEYFNNREGAAIWNRRAEELKDNLKRICWNGDFYTHFVKLSPVTIPGVDEAAQLSLSNPMAVNRGAADHKMSAAIIREYQKRRRQSPAFSEWFSIDPPFPDGIFGDEILKKGAYVNGGIMPLVGGELALAALDHGFESYGADILRRYYDLIASTGESYLWYFPDGTSPTAADGTSPESTPTDAWGSTAMLHALVAGLAGIKDTHKLWQKVTLAPRWPAVGVKSAEVRVEYQASLAYFAYSAAYEPDEIKFAVSAKLSEVDFFVLLPEKCSVRSVIVDSDPTDYKQELVEQSRYVRFSAKLQGQSIVKVLLTGEGTLWKKR